LVELMAPTPAWFTSELQGLVKANGVAAAPADAPLPGEVGIRPGSWMLSPNWCTMNYVFQNGSRLGIGTAGHCAKNGDNVVLLTVAPGGANPVLVDIGSVIVSHNGGIGNDFALIEIRPELHPWVFPTIAEIGGPCGIYTGEGLVSVPNPIGTGRGELVPSTLELGDTVYHYGHGVGMGTGGTARAGAALAWYPDSFTWAGALYGGDSGSAVRIQDLKAAGNLTHGLADGTTGLVPLGLGYGTRITKILSMISSWSLVNSFAVNGATPVMACPPGTPPTTGGGGGTGGGGPGKGGGKASR
ncbi:MAG: hypothetical protein ABIS18_03970, partial [Actinomycetota bacterium]